MPGENFTILTLHCTAPETNRQFDCSLEQVPRPLSGEVWVAADDVDPVVHHLHSTAHAT